MKARVLNTFSISKCSEKIDVPNTFRTITMWKHCFAHFFHFKMFWQKWCSKHSCYNFHMKIHVLNIFSISKCSERNDVPNTLGAISLWLTFWTPFPFQDDLEEVMFQTFLEQFPPGNSRSALFSHFKMFWKKWYSGHSWDNFHMKTHVLNSFFISNVLKEVMFKTLLEQFPNENSRSEFFSFQDVLKEVMFKTLLEEFHVKTHVLNFSFISRCSERSYVQNIFGTISTWKFTFWTLFPFQDGLKEVMFQTLLEQFPHENSHFEHFFSFQDVLKEVMFKTLLEQFPNENSRSEFFSFQDVLKEVMFKTLLEEFHVKTHVLNTLSISRYSARKNVPNTLGTISIWKLTFWTHFPFQDVLEEVMFQTPLEQIPHENSRFEHFFHFKMFWNKWCPTHFSNTYDVKTLFWAVFPCQDVLTEVMFQALLLQFSRENSRFEHFFDFKMFWKK